MPIRKSVWNFTSPLGGFRCPTVPCVECGTLRPEEQAVLAAGHEAVDLTAAMTGCLLRLVATAGISLRRRCGATGYSAETEFVD